MNTTFDVLVIVLSVLLGLFLILAIVVTVFVLKIVSAVKRVVAKGEQLVDSAEAATEVFRNAAGPMGALKMVTHLVDTVMKHSRKGKK